MSLIKHSAWNITGYLIPSIVALPVMGIIARKLGMEGFGLFTLFFAIVGYASIFDVGIARAVTRMTAINYNDFKLCCSICATATLFVLTFSCLGAVCLFLFSPNIAIFLNVSDYLREDVIVSLKILAVSIPILLLTQVWLGVLEGLEAFAIINIQRVATSSLLVVLPLISLYVNSSLSSAVIGVVLARIFTMVVVFVITRRRIPIVFTSCNKSILHNMLKFGGWLTISNIISPLMVYFDRFILSNFSGAQIVAQYTAPSDIVSRLGVIPGSIAKVLFPKLSKGADVYYQSFFFLGVSSFLVILPLFIWAEELLVLWLGSAYAGTPVIILRVLLVGFFFNALAQAPYAAIQSKGFAKVTAFVHILELLPYLLLLLFMVRHFSVIGVAITWTIRVSMDFLILLFVNYKLSLREVDAL